MPLHLPQWGITSFNNFIVQQYCVKILWFYFIFIKYCVIFISYWILGLACTTCTPEKDYVVEDEWMNKNQRKKWPLHIVLADHCWTVHLWLGRTDMINQKMWWSGGQDHLLCSLCFIRHVLVQYVGHFHWLHEQTKELFNTELLN